MCPTYPEGEPLDRPSGEGAPRPPDGEAGFPDAAEFERLHAELAGAIFGYLLRMVRSPGVAEDLLQDTWLRVIERRGQLASADRFVPWVFRIARNLALNHLRRGRRKTRLWNVSDLGGEGGPSIEDLAARNNDGMPNPRDHAIARERAGLIQEVITELDDQTREMIQLRYFEHLKLAEIAEVLDVPLGTVCTKVHRALRRIRRRMEEEGHEDAGLL